MSEEFTSNTIKQRGECKMCNVTWHPVSEPPPQDDVCYVCSPEDDGSISVIVARPRVENGRVVVWVNAHNEQPYMPEAVTHWAHMIYPAPIVEP